MTAEMAGIWLVIILLVLTLAAIGAVAVRMNRTHQVLLELRHRPSGYDEDDD